VTLGGLIDEEVLAARRDRLRREDLRAQNRRNQAGIGLSNRRPEERRHEVLIAKWKLAFDERLGELKRGLVAVEDLRRMRAAVDDLHVVDRYDRKPVRLAVEVRPRFEVADDELGAELADEIKVRGDVLRHAGRALKHVRPERLAHANAVLLGNHVKAVD